jgi:hypothetical protein
MFARYLLGDLFIHGIGGAKYDELGDAIARNFFHIEPPGFLTLSMTQWIGLPDRPANANNLADIIRELRDLEFNPDRALSEPIDPQARILIRAKHEAIAGPVMTRSERVARYREIRRINDALQPRLLDTRASLQVEKAQVLKDIAWNRVVRSREYPLVVHSARRLHDTMLKLGTDTAR